MPAIARWDLRTEVGPGDVRQPRVHLLPIGQPLVGRGIAVLGDQLLHVGERWAGDESTGNPDGRPSATTKTRRGEGLPQRFGDNGITGWSSFRVYRGPLRGPPWRAGCCRRVVPSPVRSTSRKLSRREVVECFEGTAELSCRTPNPPRREPLPRARIQWSASVRSADERRADCASAFAPRGSSRRRIHQRETGGVEQLAAKSGCPGTVLADGEVAARTGAPARVEPQASAPNISTSPAGRDRCPATCSSATELSRTSPCRKRSPNGTCGPRCPSNVTAGSSDTNMRNIMIRVPRRTGCVAGDEDAVRRELRQFPAVVGRPHGGERSQRRGEARVQYVGAVFEPSAGRPGRRRRCRCRARARSESCPTPQLAGYAPVGHVVDRGQPVRFQARRMNHGVAVTDRGTGRLAND